MGNWWDKNNNKEQTQKIHSVVSSIEQLEPLYTVEHVAKYFGVEPGTVYKWKMIGLIEPTPQGRDLRFTAKQIDECKQRRENKWRKARRKDQLEKVSG